MKTLKFKICNYHTEEEIFTIVIKSVSSEKAINQITETLKDTLYLIEEI